MRERYIQSYSNSLSRARKEIPSKSPSINHELLIQSGFVRQEGAGLYTLLPFGRRVVGKIESIIRNEMDDLGAEEISMPILQPREYLDTTGRWDTIDVLFQLKNRTGNREYALAATSEESVVPVVRDRIQSYRDLPVVVYQVGEKFRDELRAKSGVIRGREFGMKDMYSFHATQEDFLEFYQRAKETYFRIFNTCQVQAKATEASGGEYTALPTHEFHAISDAGEDTIINCSSCTFAQNSGISSYHQGDGCPGCGTGVLTEDKSIEIGHIFDLGDKFTGAFGLTYTDKDGQRKPVMMGCYGIGTTRLMATVVELHHDDKGIIWPDSIAPYDLHIVGLNLENEEVRAQATELLTRVKNTNWSVLFDDRMNVKAGEKFATADLIGIPNRIVISSRTVAGNIVEIRRRANGKTLTISMDALFSEQREQILWQLKGE